MNLSLTYGHSSFIPYFSDSNKKPFKLTIRDFIHKNMTGWRVGLSDADGVPIGKKVVKKRMLFERGTREFILFRL